MRVLMLPRYAPLGASSRLRMYQYVDSLREAGMDVSVLPLLGDPYVRDLYAGRRNLPQLLRGYARRIVAQLTASSFDLVWLEKEFLPWLPSAVERLRGRAALVVDYDDAVFHNYDEHGSVLVRRLLGGRVDKVMRRADVVTAGNAYLADRAVSAGCPRVEKLPTVVDLRRYSPRRPARPGGPLVIGWIGSPSTAHYLRLVAPAIQRLQARHTVQVVAVGARSDQVAGTPFEAVAWSEVAEAELVSAFDIGIMPLPDAPWERGKCGYKLIQYMACGLPVVASPVGVNKEIVRHGISGLLAQDEPQWEASLSTLIVDTGTRQRMGLEGRRQVEEWYSLQAQAPRLIEILRQAAQARRS